MTIKKLVIMKTVYLMSGLCWFSPGKNRYLTWGPFPTEADGLSKTAYIQGKLVTKEVEVPDWFWELVNESPDNPYLHKCMEEQGWLKKDR